jgi:hypothetical protein
MDNQEPFAESRNEETKAAINTLRASDHGANSIRPSGVAQATASLNVAESLQNLQMEISKTSAGTRKSLAELQGQISGLTYAISTVIENETKKLIASNEKLATSNEYYAKWNKRLSIALIVVTLFVGLMQAYVIWRTANQSERSAEQSTAKVENQTRT